MTSATLIRGLDSEGFGAAGFFVEALVAGMVNADYRQGAVPANAVAPSLISPDFYPASRTIVARSERGNELNGPHSRPTSFAGLSSRSAMNLVCRR